MTIDWLRLVSAVVLAGCCAGCGDSRYELARVSGTVTLDGKPVVDALVGFEPSSSQTDGFAGPGSYARTDSDGRYELETIAGRKGAVVGQHVVTISTQELDEDDEGNPVEVRPEVIPERYHEFGSLTLSVPTEGTNQADFALASSGTEQE